MKINAYVLAAEPEFIQASVLSYYDLVDRIVVSYDKDGVGWTGHPLPVQKCLDRLLAIDRDSKMQLMAGRYARPGFAPLDNDTYQRQCALDEAAKSGADWVIQLDTDEVLGSSATFLSCLREADAGGFNAMDYPARWLYRQLGERRFLEFCNRFWGIAAGYPGPVAVRPGVALTCARQCGAKIFRVDFRPKNTGGPLTDGRPIHRAISADEGIFHYSWARDEEALLAKFASWGHAKDKDWRPEFQRWSWAGKHPYLATLVSPLARGQMMGKHLRIVNIPGPRFEDR